MSKMCPNCLRTVRSGANYCGYCGASLVPTPQDPAPTMNVVSKQSNERAGTGSPKAKRVTKRNPSSRAWVKVPITLLVLVLMMALAVRYWPQILSLIGQALPLLPLS